jgi:hypothetical protein
MTSIGNLGQRGGYCHREVMTCRWGKAITFKLPASLNDIMVPFFTRGHHSLLTSNPTVFVDLGGNPLTKTNFSSYFHRMTRCLQPDFPKLAPSLLRHVFVDERMSKQRVQGPEDKGAAHVMGNSEQQWHLSYDLQFDTREAQAAVDAMDAWRQNVLAGQRVVNQLPCLKEEDEAMSSSDDDDMVFKGATSIQID